MFCPKCGTSIKDGSQFCGACGTRITKEVPETDWYYISNANKCGPVSGDGLITAIQQSAITEDTLVWCEGFTNWLPAGQTVVNTYLQRFSPSMPKSVVSDKWQWALATVPLLSSFILTALGLGPITIFTTIALNCLFISLDTKELKKHGYDAEAWLWLGLLLVPVYLFVRASRTSKQYAPGILWCVLFALDLLA